MTGNVLNGWTAPRLDELNRRVGAVEDALKALTSDEMQKKDDRIKELEGRPSKWGLAILGPIIAVVLAEVLQHVHF